MGGRAGETVSIRVPRGLPARLTAATGVPFSKLMRIVAMGMEQRYAAERDGGLPVDRVKADAAVAVEQAIQEEQKQ
jgi:hypothetical protein